MYQRCGMEYWALVDVAGWDDRGSVDTGLGESVLEDAFFHCGGGVEYGEVEAGEFGVGGFEVEAYQVGDCGGDVGGQDV